MEIEIITDNLSQLSSENGFTYCLESPCGNYIKIGKTTQRRLLHYLGADKFSDFTHGFRNKGSASSPYTSGFSVSWVFPDSSMEQSSHRALLEFRCFYYECDIYGKMVVGSDNPYGYMTKTSANLIPEFTRQDFPRSWPKHRRTIKRVRKNGVVELFNISAIDAVGIISRHIGA